MDGDKYPIILALDRDLEDAKKWIERLHHRVWGFKVGSILFTQHGQEMIECIKAKKAKVFLDLKYHDIPNTVKNSVHHAFLMGVDLLTVHCLGGSQMLKAAAEEQTKHRGVIAVTVLTSHSSQDLKELKLPENPATLVEDYATMAVEAGVRGLVCSPLEVEALRKKFPNKILITPGVRLANARVQDQKRVASPKEAFQRGATYIVLGRALTGEENWESKWEEISSSLAEIF